MTKIYDDGTCRCQHCFRLFWPKNKTELVCLECLQDTKKEREKNDDILTKLSEMLKYMVFF